MEQDDEGNWFVAGNAMAVIMVCLIASIVAGIGAEIDHRAAKLKPHMPPATYSSTINTHEE